MNSLEFFVFLNIGYPDVPHKSVIGNNSRSNFVSLPGEFYDRARGQRVLEENVDTLKFCEQLGFDGVVHSEQHGGPIGLSAQAMVTSAYLAANTERIRIAAVGPILNAYLSPVRLAEEVALVDMYSHGRLTLGLPMGIGGQYHAYGVTNPAFARRRFNEAHELLIRAMTEPGPFAFEGEFFDIPWVNLWPKPVQEPHPPIFVPAAGSRETLDLCARHRYTYQAVLTPWQPLVRNCNLFRELCENHGYEARPDQIASCFLVHVAETDAQARREIEPHAMWMMQNFFRSTFQDSFPPGHVSVGSLRGMMAGGYRSTDISEMTWDELIAENWLIAGSPETVARRLEELTDELGAGRVILMADFVSEPNWMLRKSLTLFAEEVAPRFRDADGKPVWAQHEQRRFTTASEIAVASRRKAIPASEIYGRGIFDSRTAHLPEAQPITLTPDGAVAGSAEAGSAEN